MCAVILVATGASHKRVRQISLLRIFYHDTTKNYGADTVMVTSIPPSRELCSVVAILCCKGNRYSCGASMVALWEAPHSNPKELEFILSYRVGVRES